MATSPSPGEPVGTLIELAYPEGWYAEGTWLSDGTLVVAYRRLGESGTPRLYVGELDALALTLEELEFPDDPNCTRPRYYHPAEVNGVLAVEQECLDFTPPRYRLVTFDRDAKQLTQLVDVGRNVIWFTWDSSRDRGWYSAGSHICHGVGAMDRTGPQSLDWDAIASGERISLVDTLASLGKPDCPGAPRADRPAWSEAAGTLALFASPGGPGVSGHDRLDLPWTLNLYRDGLGEPTAPIQNIAHVHGPTWSPDGRVIVFAGTIEGRRATWLYRVSEETLEVLIDEALAAPLFSPDGTMLFGVISVGLLESKPVLVRLP